MTKRKTTYDTSSFQATYNCSNISDVASSHIPPFVDECAIVATPHTIKDTPRNHSGTAYGKLLYFKSLAKLWSLGLSQYLVSHTFLFLEFMRLCAHDFYPPTSTIINSDEQTILFHITSSYVAHILDTIPVDDVISLMAHVARYRKIEQANKGNVFYQLKHNQVAHTGVAHSRFRCN